MTITRLLRRWFNSEEHQRFTEGEKSIVELLAMPEAAEIEFEPPQLRGDLHEPADLS